MDDNTLNLEQLRLTLFKSPIFSTGNISFRYEEIVRLLNGISSTESRKNVLDDIVISLHQQIYGLKSKILDNNGTITIYSSHEDQFGKVSSTVTTRIMTEEDRLDMVKVLRYHENLLVRLEKLQGIGETNDLV